MTKKYYKILMRDMTSINGANSFTIRYKLNEWTFPKIDGSGLYVFDNLENAKDFTLRESGILIYECEVVNPRKIKKLISISYLSTGYLNKLLETKKRHKKQSFYWLRDVPKGTVLCDAVKLTRLVYDKDN